jgi:hypothetical protein
LVVAATMWVAAALALGTALVVPILWLDDDRQETESRVVFALASIAAVALFLGSGPVAYWIARRRWLLALPLMGLAVWGIGIVIAYAT